MALHVDRPMEVLWAPFLTSATLLLLLVTPQSLTRRQALTVCTSFKFLAASDSQAKPIRYPFDPHSLPAAKTGGACSTTLIALLKLSLIFFWRAAMLCYLVLSFAVSCLSSFYAVVFYCRFSVVLSVCRVALTRFFDPLQIAVEIR